MPRKPGPGRNPLPAGKRSVQIRLRRDTVDLLQCQLRRQAVQEAFANAIGEGREAGLVASQEAEAAWDRPRYAADQVRSFIQRIVTAELTSETIRIQIPGMAGNAKDYAEALAWLDGQTQRLIAEAPPAIKRMLAE